MILNKVDLRFPIQTVLRPQNEKHRDFRGYAGKIVSGVLRTGDEILVLPSKIKSKIKSINIYNEKLNEAFAPMSVVVSLTDDIDISRGDMIVRVNNSPKTSQDIELMLCWLNNDSAKPRAKYSIMHTSNEQNAIIKEVIYKYNIDTLERDFEDKGLLMNDIAKVKIKTTKPLMVDSYRKNRSNRGCYFSR